MIQKNLFRRAYDLTGDTNSAVILLRIGFWYRVALKKGKEATAQSHEDLMEETGFSFDVVKRAVALLRKLGLVESQRKMFGNKNPNHFKLTKKTMGGLYAPSGQCESAPSGQCESAPSGQCESAPSYIHGENIQGDTYMENSDAVLTDNVSKASPERREKIPGEKNMGKSVKEISADFSAAASCNSKLHKPDKVVSLEFFWKQRVSELTGAFIALSVKERGMLKNLFKLCPPGKAIAVMETALKDWPFYANRVKVAAGLPYVPMSPRIDFLLKYRAEAIMLWTSAEKVNAKKQEAIAPPVFVEKPVQLPAPEPEDDDDEGGLSFADLWYEPEGN